MNRLGVDIRELGQALGRVIVRIEGQGTLDTVETLRRLAKARRAGDTSADRQLGAAVAALAPVDAFNQAMAFTLYFELVNLAEENFRVTLLRRRRAARLDDAAADAPIRESIEAAVMELKARGVDTAAMQRLVDRLAIELVFTAHPTEAKRRTLLTKLQRLGGILREREQPELVEDTSVLDPDCVEREIASLWLTDRSRASRPEVTDEARTGLWYFDTTLYATVPRLQIDLERALAFYRDALGFSVTQRYGSQAAFLSAGGYHHHIGLNTWESAGGKPPPAGTTGLYHVAFLYPTRADLADAVRRLARAGVPLDGAADHGVSEAVYLRDPDGNGVELYWDKPEEQWPRTADGGLAMFTHDLDLNAN